MLRSLEQHHHFSSLDGSKELKLYAEDADVLGAGVDVTPTKVSESPATRQAVLDSLKNTNGNHSTTSPRIHGEIERSPSPSFNRSAPKPPSWRDQLKGLRDGLPVYDVHSNTPDEFAVQDKQHWFAINLADQQPGGPLALTIFQSVRKKNGEWGKTHIAYDKSNRNRHFGGSH